MENADYVLEMLTAALKAIEYEPGAELLRYLIEMAILEAKH